MNYPMLHVSHGTLRGVEVSYLSPAPPQRMVTMLTKLLLAASLLISAPAQAGGKAEEAARAEYVRLSQDLERLVQKNAWAGVERTFQACLETKQDLAFEDWVAGAHAARALGDISAARERLIQANKLREEREVLDWLWDIDSSYGQVSLKGDLGKVELEAVQAPFDPLMAKAVAFASDAVEESGTFEGYLPQGDYIFAGVEVKVRPRVMAARIDLRTDEGMAEARKRKKKEK